MINNIEVIRNDGDLYREVYAFNLVRDTQLIVSSFRFQDRKSKRHKWVTQAYYSPYHKRESDIKYSGAMIPIDVAIEAKNMLMDMITVGVLE